MNKIYDVIIIGAGPAGLTAAIYAKRAELSTLLIERYGNGGGQILSTYEVDNYPGMPGISGTDLGTSMSEHVNKFNVERVEAEVERLELKSDVKTVKTDAGDFAGRTVILATGASPTLLGVEGEEELLGAGVSYCATCDGAFFKNRTVAVVGGGNVAVEDALFLARGCSKVYLIHRRDELRAAKMLQSLAFDNDKIEMIWNSAVVRIDGEDCVTGLSLKNVKDNSESRLDVDGVFVAVGTSPNASYVGNDIATDSKGCIVAGEECETNIPGVFVAGDLRTKRVKQVSTAVADGANAAFSAQLYLLSIQGKTDAKIS